MTKHTTATFWIGAYTTPDSSTNAYNRGIVKATLDTSSGELAFANSTLDDSTLTCAQPSFVTHYQGKLIAVSEHCAPDTPQLLLLDKLSGVEQSIDIDGDAPCHVQYSERHNLIATAQYMGGTVNLFSQDASGTWQRSQSIQRLGSGPLAHRQESAHLHQVLFLEHSSTLTAVDLGCDEVLFFNIVDNGELSLNQVIKLEAGRGPRHIVFSANEDQLYVLCELSESLCHYRKNAEGGWMFVAEHPLLPGLESTEAAAAIKLSADGRFLYASARTQNKIVSFEVLSGGELSPLQTIDCGGEFPRDFTLSPCGRWVVVANQHSHSVSVLERDLDSGLLEVRDSSLVIGSPVNILFE